MLSFERQQWCDGVGDAIKLPLQQLSVVFASLLPRDRKRDKVTGHVVSLTS